MKKIISFYEFERTFKSVRPNNFSYDGLKALFDYLKEVEEDTGEEIELDVISLCCDYSEYKNLKELREDYNDIKSIEDLRERTQVIEIENTKGFIIQSY